MADREFYYRWEWKFQSSPEALWPLASDTNRFNMDTGLPPIAVLPPKTGGYFQHLSFNLLGTAVEWEEEPFEWVQPYRFGVVRRYSSGPIAEMRVLTNLEPLPEGGTRMIYQVWVYPANPMGSLIIPLQIGVVSARNFGKIFQLYDQLAMRGLLPLSQSRRVALAPGGRERLEGLKQQLLEQGAQQNLLDHLVELVQTSDDLTLTRMRPYALADYWKTPRRTTLELFLSATRLGMLDMRWQVLCPTCRVSKQTAASLSGIQSHIHCETCNADYTINFEHSVELTFRPNAAIRVVPEQYDFCVGGPQSRPHVIIQQRLAPEERRKLSPTLELGRYQLRTMELPGGQFMKVAPSAAGEEGGLTQVELRASPEGWSASELLLAPAPELELVNATPEAQLFILERNAWSDQAATAADVTTLQAFRDLFSSEALRPGEEISVGSLTLVFTDLRDSTRLYQQIGDAPAFGQVMSHFDVLRAAIASEGGAIVKTMGDAVMAVFRQPAAGLRAIFNAQRSLAALHSDVLPLQLKVGIHQGPCIAVTLNERLDYFGSTVNIASRLAHLAAGGDIILSSQVYGDPEVAAWLGEQSAQMRVEMFAAKLKGFDTPFELQRISVAGFAQAQ